ncbi:MAG: serine O-acetyltransferase [Desulforhopalus sp.]|jgi:serine O-acetyltransferase
MKKYIWKTKCLCMDGPRIIRPFAKILYRMYEIIYGASIPWHTQFEGMPCLPHGLHGIFISGKIGKRCTIFQHVTLAYNALPGSKGFGTPIMGDDCYIGAGAVIVGNVRIGNRVRIGANCTVYEDVPDDCVVTGGKQIVRNSNAPLNNTYYAWHNGKWSYFREGDWIEETDSKILRLIK